MKNNESILNNVTWAMAEKILTEIVSSFVTIILARLILPEQYGIITFASIFINISSIFVTSGLGVSLIQKKDITDEQVNTIFALNIALGVLIFFLIVYNRVAIKASIYA